MNAIADRLSLSTCWCSGRHTDGYAMIDEMVSLGFKRVELSHGIRVSLVPGILKALEEGLVEVSSVHNFCPLPGGVNFAAPNLYKPSALDKREITFWMRYTKQTFDFAERIGVTKVVIHSGSVRFFFQSPEKKLKQWMQSQDPEGIQSLENKKFFRKRDQAMKRIRKAATKAVQRVKFSYALAIEWAKARNLKVCIENRDGLAELPIDSEFPDFMNSFSAPGQLGYWHDTGHAQIKHQLGLINHYEHLLALKDHLAGFHLHDVTKEGLDHQPIGHGTVDFKMIAEFVRPEHTLVLELNPKVSSDAVLASRDYICNLLG